nr:hypothetical protein [Hymenobacter qilianensis]
MAAVVNCSTCGCTARPLVPRTVAGTLTLTGSPAKKPPATASETVRPATVAVVARRPWRWVPSTVMAPAVAGSIGEEKVRGSGAVCGTDGALRKGVSGSRYGA